MTEHLSTAYSPACRDNLDLHDSTPCCVRYPYDRIGVPPKRQARTAMAIDVNYPELLDNFPEHRGVGRSESASFLIWYLEQYYRLDSTEAVDAVCDQGGDKGVDGIFINDNDLTITIFQSKLSHRSNSTVGDATLRSFLGTLQQFDSAASVQHLIETSGGSQLVALIKRTELLDKLGSHEVRGEFVTNIDLDHNGLAFLSHYESEITFVGKTKLLNTYISVERDLPKDARASFDIYGVSYSEHIVDIDRKAIIAPIKARELADLKGIDDQSLFAYNVRGPLGKTSVNKDVVRSIRKQDTHKLFPLFHNGITIIAREIVVDGGQIHIQDYHVVNGCQSVSALHGNRSALSDELKLLTKFIQMDPASEEAKTITKFSNNQNGVRSRDFKSNSQTQIRLRTEIATLYGSLYNYEIKRGEIGDGGKVISNEEAGLYMMAFDLGEPWGTFRKYEVFEDKHAVIFNRPEVTADRIIMLRVIDEEVQKQLPKLKHQLLAKYNLTRFMIMFMLREMFDADRGFLDVLKSPKNYVRDAEQRDKFRRAITVFIADIIIDLNVEGESWGASFDYRRSIKDAVWVRAQTSRIKKDFQKDVQRGRQNSFQKQWDAVCAEA